nr:MAG TPA: hypothetical protein [Caudoviricetes sp.]
MCIIFIIVCYQNILIEKGVIFYEIRIICN